MRISRRRSAVAAACVALSLSCVGAAPISGAQALEGEALRLDGGFVLANAARYCDRVPDECRFEAGDVAPEPFEQISALLAAVNDRVNTTTTFRLDRDQYGASDFWALPASGFGDCEDFALAKRRLLIEGGVDPRNLRITLVRFFDKGRAVNHALLGVVTSHGMRYLDMNERMIGDATAFALRFGYLFEAMQSGFDFTVYEPMPQPAFRMAVKR